VYIIIITGEVMKKLLLSAVVGGLLFTGCSQKGLDNDGVDTQGMNNQQAEQKVDDKINQIATVDNAHIESNAMSKEVTMQELQDTLKTIYFDFDKFNIKTSEAPKMEANAKHLREEKVANFGIKVEGNCDEWGTDEYNYALGLKRAKSVKDDLVNQGIAENRVMIISYGESNPSCKESKQACWDKNRRVEFKILP
jgi:peptidoglycan-associated lipoprotein